MYKRKLLCITLTLITVNVFAANSSTNNTSDSNQENKPSNAIEVDLQDVLESAIISEEAKAAHLSGISLTFQCNGVENNKPITYAVGKISHQPNAINLPKDAIFQVGSMSKSFLAVVALQLESEGVFGRKGLEVTVGEILKQPKQSLSWSLEWNQIKLRQLLNMTSGIPEYSDDDGYMMAKFSQQPYYQFTTDELIASVANKPLLFKPGHGWYYSNTNYALMNKIIYTVTGISLKKQIMKRIIKPLNLSHTYYVDNVPEDVIQDPKQKTLLMSGYDYQDLAPKLRTKYLIPGVDIKSYSLSWTNAAGSIISDTNDFNIYIRALFDGRLLNTNQQKEFTSVVAMNEGSKYKAGQPIDRLDGDTQSGYALGVQEFIVNTPKHTGIIFDSHMGGSMGFSSQWFYQKNRQASIVFETNTTNNLANGVFNSKIIPLILDKVLNECVVGGN